MNGQFAQIADILAKANDLTIATIREDGFPQATTVSFVSDGLLVYFGTGANAQKARNIARCNKVSFTVNCRYRSWDEIRGISAAAIAERVTDAAEAGLVGRLMLAKFPQIASYVAPAEAGELALFRLTPVMVSLLDYSKGFGHTDLVPIAQAEPAFPVKKAA